MTILVLSPRVAPGLLTWRAWEVLRAAATVRAASDDDHVRAIVDAGIPVEIGPELSSSSPTDVWIAPVGGIAWAQELAADMVAGEQGSVEIIHGSYDAPGALLTDLVAVMGRLRRECPWTREQTHASLSRYLLEETYETLEALDADDTELLREELGDLLMQIVFHAVIASEKAGWDIDDVAAGITSKLIRRSPHVFAGSSAKTAADVDAAWQEIKASEKQRTSADEGIPAALPALAYADKMLGRLGQVEIEGEDLGARLLRLVQEARQHNADAEGELRRAVRALLT